MLNKKHICLMSLGLVCLGAVPASAETSEDTQPQVRVNYSDLNLATSEGAEALNRRVLQAIAAVCARPIVNWTDQVAQRNCEIKASAQVDAQVRQALSSAKQAFAMKDSQGTMLDH